jgi:hypothetical protein
VLVALRRETHKTRLTAEQANLLALLQLVGEQVLILHPHLTLKVE